MSLLKWTKKTVIACAVLGAAGLFVFGSDLISYVRTGTNIVRSTVTDAVPIEVELRRARDAVEDLIPETHACIKLIAEEEVEIDTLDADIARGENMINDQRAKLAKLRDALNSSQASFTFAGHDYSRPAVKAELNRRFESVKNGEIVLNGKKRLLDRRKQSLTAAARNLEEMRAARLDLQAQIEALESQHRLVQAASAHASVKVDASRVNDARRIITQIKKRLDVAERILEKDHIFVESIPVDSISEEDLVTNIDEYLADHKPGESLASSTDKSNDL